MRNMTIFSFAILFMISGCAGKQGVVNVDQSIPTQHVQKDYGIRKAGQVRFGVLGHVSFSGRPDSLSYYAYSVDVNLKAIQEAVARKVLSSIYDDVVFSGSRADIYSEITDFSYSWGFSVASKPEVSFKLALFYMRDGQRVLFKESAVKDFNGDEEETLLGAAAGMILGPIGALLGAAANEEPDKRSQLVTNAVIKAVYDTYEKELPDLVRSLDGN